MEVTMAFSLAISVSTCGLELWLAEPSLSHQRFRAELSLFQTGRVGSCECEERNGDIDHYRSNQFSLVNMKIRLEKIHIPRSFFIFRGVPTYPPTIGDSFPTIFILGSWEISSGDPTVRNAKSPCR